MVLGKKVWHVTSVAPDAGRPWQAYFGVDAVAAVGGGRQRLRRRAPHGPRRRGRGRGRGCAAAQKQVISPQAHVRVTACGRAHFLSIDGATEENNEKQTKQVNNTTYFEIFKKTNARGYEGE